MAKYTYDITVIGGGPGGYVAAIKAAKEGKKTCLVEGKSLGGVCLNEGCIPTKTLIKTANLLGDCREAGLFAVEGADTPKLAVDMKALQKRKQAVVSQLVGGVGGLLAHNGVTVVAQNGTFVDSHTLKAGGETLTSETFIIATGSEALMPSFIPLEGKTHVLTSREALELDKVPASVSIIGGGVIGIEFAYLFNKLGAEVTVLELMESILPMVDEEISAMVQKRMESQGVTFHLGANVQKVKGQTTHFEKSGRPGTVKSDIVLMAVGRVPNTKGLGVEEVNLALEKNAIITDKNLRTNVPNIYAIGDVNGKVMLAHTASHEGMMAVDNILGKKAVMDYGRIPSCIYLEPEVASIGLTEKAAKKQKLEIRMGRFPMVANGKSLVEGDTDGMIKVIVGAKYGEVLGAHLYAKHATDMIGELSLAMTLEATADEIIETVHPHPTVCEALPEAFMAAYNKAIHSM